MTDIDTIRVRPWPDPVIDTLGLDPRSLYVETFWLPTLGPTSFLVLRHLARRFEEAGPIEAGTGDAGTVLDVPVAATAHALGLGPRDGQNAPLRKALERLVQFDLAFAHADGSVSVRASMPPATRRHLRRLPEQVRAEHEEWVRARPAPPEVATARARRVAMTLVELGNDVDVVERSLHATGFRPLVCREAATWAQAVHRAAERAAGLPGASLDEVA